MKFFGLKKTSQIEYTKDWTDLARFEYLSNFRLYFSISLFTFQREPTLKQRGKVALRVLLFHSCWGKLCSYFEATSPTPSSGCFSQISLRMNIECQTKQRKLGQSIAFFKQVPSPLTFASSSFVYSFPWVNIRIRWMGEVQSWNYNSKIAIDPLEKKSESQISVIFSLEKSNWNDFSSIQPFFINAF